MTLVIFWLETKVRFRTKFWKSSKELELENVKVECETESQAKVRRDVPWLDFSDLSEVKRVEFYSIYGNVRCICSQNSHFCCLLLVVYTAKMDIENNFIGEFVDDLAYITDNEGSSESSNEEEEEVNSKQVREYRRSKFVLLILPIIHCIWTHTADKIDNNEIQMLS